MFFVDSSWVGAGMFEFRQLSVVFFEFCGFSLIFVYQALKMVENHEKLCFTLFALLPPYIVVSGSLMPRKR